MLQGSLVPSVSSALPQGFWESLKIAVASASKEDPLTVVWSLLLFGFALVAVFLFAHNRRADSKEKNANNWKALDQNGTIKARDLQIKILKQQLADMKQLPASKREKVSAGGTS